MEQLALLLDVGNPCPHSEHERHNMIGVEESTSSSGTLAGGVRSSSSSKQWYLGRRC